MYDFEQMADTVVFMPSLGQNSALSLEYAVFEWRRPYGPPHSSVLTEVCCCQGPSMKLIERIIRLVMFGGVTH